VVAGYTGTHQRATYTCVGNTVNLAARLEGHTKEVGHPILVDGATQSQLRDPAGLVALGLVSLKGVPNPIQVFSVDAL